MKDDSQMLNFIRFTTSLNEELIGMPIPNGVTYFIHFIVFSNGMKSMHLVVCLCFSLFQFSNCSQILSERQQVPGLGRGELDAWGAWGLGMAWPGKSNQPESKPSRVIPFFVQ